MHTNCAAVCISFQPQNHSTSVTVENMSLESQLTLTVSFLSQRLEGFFF